MRRQNFLVLLASALLTAMTVTSCKSSNKQAAGVDARLHVAEKMGHVYPLWPGHEGRKARREIAEIISNSPDSPSN